MALITPKVAESFQNDIGRGIIRIDSKAKKELGVATGDIVRLSGKKAALAIVWQAHPEDEGLEMIRMDGILRQNAGVGLGDRVKVEPVQAKEAKKVVLAPRELVRFSPGFDQYVKKRLVGKPVLKGNLLPVGIFGTSVPLIVSQVFPQGPVIIGEKTELRIVPEPVKDLEAIPNVTYDDVGGLKDAIQKLREMVELPLRHPEIFERLGIDPPKGVLLYGPPGTGKTLMAKAVANESDANFHYIGGPEVVSKFVGESEERLRKIFQEAQENAPSIIFIDELDAIAPKRSEVLGEVEKRLVSQLLTLLDGLKARGEVIIIGATNREDSIDPALRRPGRFDREIEIGVPDVKGRLEILHIHVRNMPIGHYEPEAAAKTIYSFFSQLTEVKNGKSELSSRINSATNSEMSVLDENIRKVEMELRKAEEEREQLTTNLKNAEKKLSELNKSALKKDEDIISKLKRFISEAPGARIELERDIRDKTTSLKSLEQRKEKLEKTKKELILKTKELEEVAKLAFPKAEKTISTLISALEKSLIQLEHKRRNAMSAKEVEIETKIDLGVLPPFVNRSLLMDIAKDLETENNNASLVIQMALEMTREMDVFGKKLLFDEDFANLNKEISTASTNYLINELAGITHGYTGADLSLLAKEAAIKALRRVLPEIDLRQDFIAPEILDKLKVTRDDFFNGLREIMPSALREVFVERPTTRWDEIGGLESVKIELREAVELPLKSPELFERMGVRPLKGILLYGPPGTGKTLLAKAVAHETEANFIAISGAQVLSKYVGESEKAMREIFKKARMAAPCILFVDEIDAIAPFRSGSGGEGTRVTERLVDTFLTEIDGLKSLKNVVVIGATNRPDILDSALLRAGRFDRIIEISRPDEAARLAIMKIHTAKMPLDSDVSLSEIARLADGYTGADMENVVREAGMSAIREGAKKVKAKHFQAALKQVMPITRKEHLEHIQKFKNSSLMYR
jgi:CDC48 subfamily AAA family ATPase